MRWCSRLGALVPRESPSCSPSAKASVVTSTPRASTNWSSRDSITPSAGVLLDRETPELAPPVRERLLEDAAGNPLALLELPAGLSETQLAGRALLPDAIPLNSRLQAAFSQRLQRLPNSTQAALLLAAAETDGEPAIVLRAAAALGLASGSLDAAERAGLIDASAERLSFRHPLVRSAVYESATLAERRRAHAALAEACSESEHADRRVWHWSVATIGADEQIAAALEASAERSELRGGQASAATSFERAARLSDTDQARGRRLGAAARTALAAGQVGRAGDLVRRALPLASRADRPRLLGLSAIIESFAGSLPEAITTTLDGIAAERGSVAEPPDAPGRVWHDRVPGRLREDA